MQNQELVDEKPPKPSGKLRKKTDFFYSSPCCLKWSAHNLLNFHDLYNLHDHYGNVHGMRDLHDPHNHHSVRDFHDLHNHHTRAEKTLGLSNYLQQHGPIEAM